MYQTFLKRFSAYTHEPLKQTTMFYFTDGDVRGTALIPHGLILSSGPKISTHV